MALEDNWIILRSLIGAITTPTLFICQKSGNDANAGNKATPKKTIEVNTSGSTRVQIRSGYYRPVTPITGVLYFDGHVVIELADVLGNSANAVSFIAQQARGKVLNASYGGGYESTAIVSGLNIDFININRTGNNATSWGKCLILGGSIGNMVAVPPNQLQVRNTFINLKINEVSSNTVFKGCFFDSDCWVKYSTNRNVTFNSCAFESGFIIQAATDLKSATLAGDGANIGTQYADGEKFSGTITNGTGTIIFQNCFWTDDPGFNNPAAGDYTLKVSPQSKLFNQSNVIGCYGLHLVFDANHSAFDPGNSGVSYTNVTRTTGGSPAFTLTSPGEGTVVSTDDPTKCIDLGQETFLNQIVEWINSFNYYNGDWVDRENYDAGVNDEVRLTWRVQIYDENEPEGANDPANWSDWYEMELFTPIQLNSSNEGNGEPGVNLAAAFGSPTARRLRVEFTLRDNGV